MNLTHPRKERKMAKKVKIIGAKPKLIRVLDKPQRRIEPAELAAALGARPRAEYVGENLDLISFAELGAQLLRRLRSSGGRPALTDATEFCRVPLSAEDMKALVKMSAQIEQSTGTKPSPGQIASVIVHDYLSSGSADSQDLATIATLQSKMNQHLDSIAASIPHLAEIVNDANTLEKRAKTIETTAMHIKEDIDNRLKEVLTLLHQAK
jgi:hypothetical protein